MNLDPDTCYQGLLARDARFDGVFYVGVSSTGIYCRPVCPARVPRRDRCTFYADPATAEAAGFRACLRCRPERAPGNAPVDAVSRLVRRAVARIESGALNDGSLDALAASLGVTARHLRRSFEAELGTSPTRYAATRRLALARHRLADTRLPIGDVAAAAGFGSVRRFQDAVRTAVGRSASDLRRGAASAPAELRVTLDTRPPFDGPGAFAFVASRAIPGVEAVTDGVYRRTVAFGDRVGVVTVALAGPRRVTVGLSLAVAPMLPQVVARVRRLLDLDAHPDAVAAVLGADPTLRDAVARNPGLRVPGAFEPFELAIRAILGQQVSVKGATTLAGRLVAAFGTPVEVGDPALTALFPSPHRLAEAPIDAVRAIGMPEARARTIVAVARAVADERVDLGPGADPAEVAAALVAIPGIGPWTAEYVAMRGLGWPDAFPAGDLVLRKVLGVTRDRDAIARAEPWRPWRSYAVLHLWTSGT
ncbi:MAG: AlkA N-terminal domain-containing protein [Myxococcota bacterium]